MARSGRYRSLLIDPKKKISKRQPKMGRQKRRIREQKKRAFKTETLKVYKQRTGNSQRSQKASPSRYYSVSVQPKRY